jgi:uncharacterized protein YecT (DUF1311 family)
MLVRMKAVIFLCFLVIPGAAGLSAQSDDSDAECKQYLQTPLPAEALNIPAPKAWPDCDSYKSYSGLGRKVDYEAARKCAWQERLATQTKLEPRYTVASIVGGSAMLAILYANGEGVQRNPALAKRFACEAEIPNALEDIDHPSTGGTKLSFCDYAADTMRIGFCGGWDSELQDQARHQFFDKLAGSWPINQRTALRELIKAEELYSEAHARGELNVAGTGRASWALDEQTTLRDNFKAALESFENGHLPSGGPRRFSESDAELNALYQTAVQQADVHKAEYGAVQPESIRKAERAWIKYRDAWVKFAKLRYPSTSSDAWLTLLTADRIVVLRSTLCEIGIDSDSPACGAGDQPKESLPLP